MYCLYKIRGTYRMKISHCYHGHTVHSEINFKGQVAFMPMRMTNLAKGSTATKEHLSRLSQDGRMTCSTPHKLHLFKNNLYFHSDLIQTYFHLFNPKCDVIYLL